MMTYCKILDILLISKQVFAHFQLKYVGNSRQLCNNMDFQRITIITNEKIFPQFHGSLCYITATVSLLFLDKKGQLNADEHSHCPQGNIIKGSLSVLLMLMLHHDRNKKWCLRNWAMQSSGVPINHKGSMTRQLVYWLWSAHPHKFGRKWPPEVDPLWLSRAFMKAFHRGFFSLWPVFLKSWSSRTWYFTLWKGNAKSSFFPEMKLAHQFQLFEATKTYQ